MSDARNRQLNEVPQHIAIIMDGNGRWAKARGMNRLAGHREGVNSVLACIETAGELGVKFLTLYTFSTENWNRPREEIDGLMSLLVESIRYYTDDMMKKGVRLKFIGERSELSESVQAAMKDIESKTASNKKVTVMPALNYGGRREILSAVKKLAILVKKGELAPAEINEKIFTQNLYTDGIPDPDLLIRTSGEMRLSNFLLWQLSYAEFYVTDTYWPDFRETNFREAVQSYRNRSRRFGGVDA